MSLFYAAARELKPLACTQQGILFRDLKPENVLLAAGSAKLTDFGAAIDLRSERAVSRLVGPQKPLCPVPSWHAEGSACQLHWGHQQQYMPATAWLAMQPCRTHSHGLACLSFTKGNQDCPLQGTLAYMSPEVLCAPDEAHIEQHAERAASYGYQADVWALGAMAYELLLGASPFSGPSQSAMIKARSTAWSSTVHV